MNMEKSMLLEIIGDTLENRTIDMLIEGMGIDYTKKDIADNCKISRPTVYKILPKLIKEGIAKPTRKIGKVQLYSLNSENEKVKALIKLEEFLLNKSFPKSIEKIRTNKAIIEA
jgi:predicted transcriptional regulator